MKAILEFDLPEDDLNLELSLKGSEVIGVLFELINNDLRSKIKYGTDTSDLTPNEADKFRNYLVNYLNENGVMVLINKYF